MKLKEISYIHAEGYAAGEMKHGPIALIDDGIPVVVIATKGHGYEKVLSNLAEVRAALMDSVPMIVMTGQTITPMLGKDAFQEADVTGITYAVTKHSYLVKDAERHAATHGVMTEAFHIATTGRPGPGADRPAQEHHGSPCRRQFRPVDLPGYYVPEPRRRGRPDEGRHRYLTKAVCSPCSTSATAR